MDTRIEAREFLIYTAECGSPSQQRLDLLARWATTAEQRAPSGHQASSDTTKETTP